MIYELSASELRRSCDPKTLQFQDRAEIGHVNAILGQERAVRAMRFGLDIPDKGFNVWSIATIDEAIEVLTGMPAGNRKDGEFASDAVYSRVDRRLARMAEEMASFDNKGERHETSMNPTSP